VGAWSHDTGESIIAKQTRDALWLASTAFIDVSTMAQILGMDERLTRRRGVLDGSDLWFRDEYVSLRTQTVESPWSSADLASRFGCLHLSDGLEAVVISLLLVLCLEAIDRHPWPLRLAT
jgi:hypothetical protein